MNNIIDRQTFIISVNFATAAASINIPMNLRFAADMLVVKSILYTITGGADVDEMVQIWCNITNDNIIGVFSNNTRVGLHHNEHFSLNNTFQIGNMNLQFQKTDAGAPFYYNPQPLITPNGNTKGTVSITIEFLKTK